MRKFSLPIALVVVLVAGVALAVKPDVVVFSITPTAIGDITGEFRLQQMKNGDVRVHGHLDNLVPNNTYGLGWDVAPCGGGTFPFAEYNSNPKGKASFNAIIQGPVDVNDILSIAVLHGVVIEACAP